MLMKSVSMTNVLKIRLPEALIDYITQESVSVEKETAEKSHPDIFSCRVFYVYCANETSLDCNFARSKS